jgi:hypothetical protein
LSDRDEPILFRQYLISTGRRPIKFGDCAGVGGVELGESALSIAHGFADGHRSPPWRSFDDHATLGEGEGQAIQMLAPPRSDSPTVSLSPQLPL